MMARESDVSGVRLRRGLAGLEFLVAALTVLMGIGFATADRVGGDGIATGIANQYGPVFVLIGLIIGHAARVAWRGSPRWWGWQLKMIGLSLGIVLVTTLILIMSNSPP
jgi:hypothetical protein